MAVIASLPPQQTVFEYLVGSWKRLNATRSALLKRVPEFFFLNHLLTRFPELHPNRDADSFGNTRESSRLDHQLRWPHSPRTRDVPSAKHSREGIRLARARPLVHVPFCALWTLPVFILDQSPGFLGDRGLLARPCSEI